MLNTCRKSPFFFRLYIKIYEDVEGKFILTIFSKQLLKKLLNKYIKKMLLIF